MTPVALGELNPNAPVPTGSRQLKRGAANVLRQYNNQTPAGTPIYDNSTGTIPMQIAVTPQYDCWWRISAMMIWTSPDVIWSRIDTRAMLSQPGEDGFQAAYALCRCHNSISYQQAPIETVYALKAGVAYTCTLQMTASSNNNQQVYCGPFYLWIAGQTVGMGVR